jgi:tetratricopeptide (TPR) repeat protein
MGDEARAREHLARAGRTGVRAADPVLAEVDAARVGEIAAVLRGRRAAMAGDWPAAAGAFREALAANPESTTARVNLAAALASTGDLAGAARELQEVLAREPRNVTAHYNLGSLLLFAGDAAAAEPHLSAVVAAQPGDAAARRGLGEALLALGRPGEALPHLEQAVLLAPADEGARFAEAVALLSAGSLRLARERLEDGLRQLPDAGRLVHLLARLLASAPDLALRDGARAVELAAQVWAVQPSPPHGRTLAFALAEAGRCDEAAALARRLAAEMQGEEAAALAAAAEVYDAGPPCRPGVEAGDTVPDAGPAGAVPPAGAPPAGEPTAATPPPARR